MNISVIRTVLYIAEPYSVNSAQQMRTAHKSKFFFQDVTAFSLKSVFLSDVRKI